MKRTLLALLLPLVAIACEREPELPVLWPAPTFTLTNQNNEPFGTEQLKGRTWIATLFFTTCPGPCPMMAHRLREIQNAVKDPELRIVSISCDPVNDTPAKLKEYADVQDADPNRWFFLTGKPDEVQRVAAAFKLDFEPATDKDPISHSTRFLLIDKSGNVRGQYKHDDRGDIQQLQLDAATLARE